MIKKTLVLDDILDPEQGWPFNQNQVPIERDISDNTPFYILKVDGVIITAHENLTWAEGAESTIDPSCIVFMAQIEGLKINDSEESSAILRGLLLDSFDLRGAVCPGIDDDDGQVYFLTTLPFAKGFPVKWLRKQFMVSVGLIAEQTRNLERALAENTPDLVETHEEVRDESSSIDDVFKSNAANAAGGVLVSIASMMLRAFLLDD